MFMDNMYCIVCRHTTRRLAIFTVVHESEAESGGREAKLGLLWIQTE